MIHVNKRLEEVITETTGVNVHYYRQGVIERCIRRRMQACNTDDPEEYADILENNDEEMDHLLEKLTINITDFFRAKSFFETLKDILSRRYSEGDKISVWSAACSKGQEPYSLAIILEELGLDYEILATDISNEALDFAREGVYEEKHFRNLSKKRLNSAFEETENGYRVKKGIRNRIRFGRHDIISSNIPGEFDVITCRNVVKFFDRPIQKTVFINLHRALSDKGILGVGMVESVPKDHEGELFNPINSGKKIYEKI